MTLTLRSRTRAATRARLRRGPRTDWRSLLYVLPAMAFFIAFVIYPIGVSFEISFFDYDGVTAATWAGVANYVAIVTDPALLESLAHSVVLLLFCSVLPIVLGLILAAIVARVTVRGLTAFRALIFAPQILATVVVALSWRNLLAEDGPLNAVLRAVGLGALATDWLGNYSTALVAIGVIGAWVQFGLCLVLFLSGMAVIDQSLYEAARLDGANSVREFFSVTLPAIRPQLSVAFILTATFALRNFDVVWNTTRGGPGTSTTVPSLYVYQDAFQNRELGAASALAIVVTLVILALVGVTQLALRERA